MWTGYRRQENEIGLLYDCRGLLQREKAESMQLKFFHWDERVSENKTFKEWTGELVVCK